MKYIFFNSQEDDDDEEANDDNNYSEKFTEEQRTIENEHYTRDEILLHSNGS